MPEEKSNQPVKKEAAVFIDAANYHYGLVKHGWKIDYLKFLNFFKSRSEVNKVFYYEGTPTKRIYFTLNPGGSLKAFEQQKQRKRSFFGDLRKLGITVRSKPVASMYDSMNNKYQLKCNFDVELTIEAMDLIDEVEEFCLCTGDGDFEKLIRYLKGKHKAVYLVSFRDRCSSSLKKAKPEEIIWLDKIKAKIELK